jgi:hypothetical protein
MKIKIKIILIIFAATLLTNKLFSQGIYAKINAGYGLQMSSQKIDYFHITNYSIDTVSSTYERVNTSLGIGFTCEGAFGYMFNKNIGAELGVSYLLGTKTNTKQVLIGSIRNNSLSSNMLRINPSIVIAFDFKKINPYAKLGLIIGIGKIMYEDDYTSSSGLTAVTEKMELNGGIALGLNAGIGTTYNISNRISLFGEINMVNLSYSPTKGILTESNLNGVDRLPNMTTREKEVNFVNSYTTNANTPNSQTEPRQELKESFPFGSVGAVIGLRVNF